MLAGHENRGKAMIRKLLIAVAASALLAGCVSDYAYRGGSGDYYYGRSSAYGHGYGYGAPYSTIGYGYGYPGGWYGGVGYGYGYGSRYGYYPGYDYYGYSRPYYYPYYYRPHRPHRPRPPHRPEGPEKPRPGTDGPVMAGPRPAVRRSAPPPAGADYTRLPSRRGDAPAIPVRPRGDAVARPRTGSQPAVRPQTQAPVRAAVPQQSRPAPRASAPRPRTERDGGRESSRRHED